MPDEDPGSREAWEERLKQEWAELIERGDLLAATELWLRQYRAAIKATPADPELRLACADRFCRTAEHMKVAACQQAMFAVHLAPNSPRAHAVLGWTLVELDREGRNTLDAGIAEFREALRLLPLERVET